MNGYSNIPNVITCLRIALILPLIMALLQHNYTMAFYLFVIAGFSDGIDGFLARRFGWISQFGAMIDPLADKLLIMTTYLILTSQGFITLWLLTTVLTRDIFIMLGVMVCNYLFVDFKFQASFVSKINTVLQIALVFLVLLNLSFLHLPQELIERMMYLVLLTTIVSFIDYFWVWSRRALTLLR